MNTARNFLAAELVLLVSVSLVYSFEIAIYHDPVSEANDWYLAAHGDWYSRSDSSYFFTDGYFPNLSDNMQDVYHWYQDMGITKVMVNYVKPWNFSLIPSDTGMGIKVMNWNYPGPAGMRGDKYVDAQFRNIQLGYDQQVLPPNDPRGYWSNHGAIGDSAERTTYQPPDAPSSSPCVGIGPGIHNGNGVADTLWRVTSELGRFSGWSYYTTGWLDSSIYMPMHFRLTWAVDPSDDINTSTGLADFYWLVHTPKSTMFGVPNVAWWRYPAFTLKLPSDDAVNNWIVSEFTDSLTRGWYHLLDSNFAIVDSGQWDQLCFGPANPSRALDDVSLMAPAYGAKSDVRMCVNYRGVHSFYLNRIEAYDEGAYRMFALSGQDSLDAATAIATAFSDEYHNSYGKSCGWYYDEWDHSGENDGNPVLRSIVNVNKILQTHNLPTFFINGDWGFRGCDACSRNALFTEMGYQGVTIPVHMDEVYFTSGSHVCREWTYRLWTDTSSDADYIECDPNGCAVQQTYHGTKSLQCGIDEFIFGSQPLYDNYLTCVTDPYIYSRKMQFVEQVAHAHEAGRQMWALLAGGDDNEADNNNDSLDSVNCCTLRIPTPNEVKLSAWLAVACDADGIMWYPWAFGGLLRWTDTTHTTVVRTDSYYEAQNACQEILRIAPILDSLRFVKTYASRAYEVNYPDSVYEATQRDVLDNNTSWNGRSWRSVAGIFVYPPDSTEESGWSDDDESNAYVQVSRFRNGFIPEDSSRDDYWFLFVNRRALPGERRKIRLAIEIDSLHSGSPYFADYYVNHMTKETDEIWVQNVAMGRYIDVELEPGEAELVHMFHGCPDACETPAEYLEGVTARFISGGITLRWPKTDRPDDWYVIYGSLSSEPISDYVPIGCTTDTVYVDNWLSANRRYYYMVSVCNPALLLSSPPTKPAKAVVPKPAISKR